MYNIYYYVIGKLIQMEEIVFYSLQKIIHFLDENVFEVDRKKSKSVLYFIYFFFTKYVSNEIYCIVLL